MGLKTAIREAGRVLSKANQDKLTTASDHMQTAHGHIQDVIASVAGGAGDGAEQSGDGMGVTEAERSYQQLIDMINDAAQNTYGGDAMANLNGGPAVCVQDAYEDYAIISLGGDLISVPWSVVGDKVTLGAATPVDVTYTATTDMSGDGDNDADDGTMAAPGVPSQESRRITPGTMLREADAPTKTEGGKAFHKGDYAYTPSDAPGSWKLRLTNTPGGAPDAAIIGMAAAALGPGMDGNKVQIPAADLAGVKAKVRAAWNKANPDKSADEMPDGIKEAAASDLDGDLVSLLESTVRADGTVPLKLIQPGWGSSGYYSPELLERDGPKVFTKGLKMFWDHPTISEESDRPERSLRDLAGELTSDARWDPNGPAGAGLYADAKVFEGFRPYVDDLAPHIGVSIRAEGRATNGDADGRHGAIVEAITGAKSVDYVTAPGAGGQVLQLFEAARAPQKGPAAMTAANTPLSEAQALRIARLEEALVLRDADAFVANALRSVDLPDMTRARIAEALSKNPPAKDGVLDREALATRLEEAVKAETAYLVEVAGYGRVSGMGAHTPADANDPVKIQESLADAFAGLGLSPEAAKLAAQGRR